MMHLLNRNRKQLKKQMGKKGVFYSLSVVLFLVFLIILFTGRAQLQKKDEAFRLERAQIIVMDHFARDFDRYYAENILHTAAKPALTELTKSYPFTISTLNNMTDLMDDRAGTGVAMNPLLSTNEGFSQSLGTLSFLMDDAKFNYSLESLEQLNYTSFRLNFSVSYSFRAFDSSEWSKADKVVNIIVSVYGLTHPAYNKIIDSSWIENDSSICYVNQIISDSAPCTGMNIMPHPVCGNGELESGEECDDGNTVSGDGCDEYCNEEMTVP